MTFSPRAPGPEGGTYALGRGRTLVVAPGAVDAPIDVTASTGSTPAELDPLTDPIRLEPTRNDWAS